MDNTVIVFAKTPKPGKVKTRLAATLGDKKVLTIYKKLLEHTLSIAAQSNAQVKVYWSEKKDKADLIQNGNDIGERMYNALKAESKNSVKTCLIGTDIPALSSVIIKSAFVKLDDNDMVFGPSKDGGYYLVACKGEPQKELFLAKKWSHNQVLNEALDICKSLCLKVNLLPSLMDIDTAEDYKNWLLSNE